MAPSFGLGPFVTDVGLNVLELHLELFDQPGVTFGAMAILLPAELGDLQPKMPDYLLGGRDDRLNLKQLALGGDQCAFRRRCAGFCCGKGGAKNSDLRGGLRHAKDLPQDPRVIQ